MLFLLLFQEGGFVRKWISDEMDRVAREAASKAVQITLKPLALDDLQVPFYLFLGCAAVAVAAFLFELLVGGISDRGGSGKGIIN